MDNERSELRWREEQRRVHTVQPVLGWTCKPRRPHGAVRGLCETGVHRPEPLHRLRSGQNGLRQERADLRPWPWVQVAVPRTRHEPLPHPNSAVAEGNLVREDSSAADLPPNASAQTPERGVAPVTLRSVVGAIRRNEAMDVKYPSLSNQEHRLRWITPDAIAFDGLRWHTRARCQTDECFKDFLLSQAFNIRGSRESDAPAENYHDWNTQVTRVVGVGPTVLETQAKVTARDSAIREVRKKIKVWRALLCYAPKRLRLDIIDADAKKQQGRQIVILNRDIVHQDHG
jgi:hypothetical protein